MFGQKKKKINPVLFGAAGLAVAGTTAAVLFRKNMINFAKKRAKHQSQSKKG
ncbi:MAG: hypothetical protein M1365_00270 [Actinobacteria bacterium]|nr:hypothetical protein [Actinomycetota bacterium]